MWIEISMGCNFVGCDSTENIEVDDNISDEALDDLAYEMALEFIEPWGAYKRLSEKPDDE